MKSLGLTFFVFIGLASPAYAERLQSICYWEVRDQSGETVAFEISNTFEVEVDAKDNEALSTMETKLQMLFKDHSMYNVFGRKKYQRDIQRIWQFGGFPTCLQYPEALAEHIVAQVEQKAARAEAKMRKPRDRRNWPSCPGTIDLHSDYNYVGTPVATICY